jgi:hypothetical protein
MEHECPYCPLPVNESDISPSALDLWAWGGVVLIIVVLGVLAVVTGPFRP